MVARNVMFEGRLTEIWSLYGTPRIPKTDSPLDFATTIPEQKTGIAALREAGFKRVATALHEGHGNKIAFWLRKNKGNVPRASLDARDYSVGCCGLRTTTCLENAKASVEYCAFSILNTKNKVTPGKRIKFLGCVADLNFYLVCHK